MKLSCVLLPVAALTMIAAPTLASATTTPAVKHHKAEKAAKAPKAEKTIKTVKKAKK